MSSSVPVSVSSSSVDSVDPIEANISKGYPAGGLTKKGKPRYVTRMQEVDNDLLAGIKGVDTDGAIYSDPEEEQEHKEKTAAVTEQDSNTNELEAGVFGLDTDDFAEKYKGPPKRLIRAEAVLKSRTSRFVLVMEELVDSMNHQAILRTAESMGVQYIYIIQKLNMKKNVNFTAGSLTMGAGRWLTLEYFPTVAACVAALRADGREIWATALTSTAVPLTSQYFSSLPKKLAVVIGREVDGVSAEFLAAADKHVILPMYGFSESFNVSVASALLIQRLFDLAPDAHGDLTKEQCAEIRSKWYPALANIRQQDEYDDWLRVAEEQIVPLAKFEDIRPAEENRMPRIPRTLVKKMEARGMRTVDVFRHEKGTSSTPTTSTSTSTSSTSEGATETS